MIQIEMKVRDADDNIAKEFISMYNDAGLKENPIICFMKMGGRRVFFILAADPLTVQYFTVSQGTFS